MYIISAIGGVTTYDTQRARELAARGGHICQCRIIFISNFSDILFVRKLKMPAYFQPSALKEHKGKIQLYSLVWQPMLLAVMTPLSIW